jgi:16S rRNA processing protein RimM
LKVANRFLAVARIAKAQGRRGEVAAEILTDFPERFQKLRGVTLEHPGGERESAEIENAWPHKGGIILKFSGVDSISSAERLRGTHVLIPESQRVQLPAGSFYVWELAGCRVMRNCGGSAEEIGTVIEVERTAGADLLHVESAKSSKREVLIPLAEAICKRIDTRTREIWVDPPEDLLDLNG